MKVAIYPGQMLDNALFSIFEPGAISKENGVTFAEADIGLRLWRLGRL